MTKNIVSSIAVAVFIYIGTLVEFPLPGTDILQTGQTLAVLCAGAFLGPVWGSLGVVLYVVSGALGLPVFSEGGSGLDSLLGPSGGYLIGFIIGAGFLGFWKRRGLLHKLPGGFLGMLLGHFIILLCGWAWLATQVGLLGAYQGGVAPFFVGSLVKSLMAILLVLFVRKTREILEA